jgi:hypothetical protein
MAQYPRFHTRKPESSNGKEIPMPRKENQETAPYPESKTIN